MGAVVTDSIPFIGLKRLGLRGPCGFDGLLEGVFSTVAGQFQAFQEREQMHAAKVRLMRSASSGINCGSFRCRSCVVRDHSTPNAPTIRKEDGAPWMPNGHVVPRDRRRQTRAVPLRSISLRTQGHFPACWPNAP